MAEVAKHKSQDDVWMVIHNKIYDVTKYLDDHPGGMEVCPGAQQMGSNPTRELPE